MRFIKTGSIYIIRNTVNDKVYIGQTTMSINERFYAHKKPSTHKARRTYKLYNAMAKYGVDKFYIEPLEENVPIEKLDEKEIEYISKFGSFENGYNSTKGGDGRIINKLENEDEVLRLAKEGVTTVELGSKYGVHPATIGRTLHKLGFYYPKTDENEVIRLIESGLTYQEVADIVGCDKVTVQRVFHKHGGRRRRQFISIRTDIDYDSMFKDYINQMPVAEILRKYNISGSSFTRLRKKYDIPARPQIYKKRSKNNHLK